MLKAINKKNLNSILLLLVVFLLFFLAAKLIDNKLSHEYPYGYLASDAFWDLTEIEFISKEGNYKYEPPWKCAGFEDCFGYTIAVWYHVASVFSLISGLEPHVLAPFLSLFFSILASLIAFFIIKKINYKLALFSTPLIFFLYTQNFKLLYIWGYWDVILANLFLFCAILCMLNIKTKRVEYALGIFIAGTFMTHLVEFAYLLGLAVLYAIFMFINKKYGSLKKLGIAYALSFIIMFYFILNQYIGTFLTQNKGSISFQAAGKVDWWVPVFQNFGLFKYIIIIGIIIILISLFYKFRKKEENSLVYLAFIYLALVCVFNYLPLGHFSSKAFTMRFLWPIILAPAFGMVVYQIYLILTRYLKTNKSLTFLLLFFAVTLSTFIYVNKDVGAVGSMMNRDSWDAFNWLRENTKEDVKVLYVYGDYYTQSAYLLSGHRTPYYIITSSIMDHLKNKKITNQIRIDVACCPDTMYSYRSSFLGLTSHLNEENYNMYINNSNFCDFDYYHFDKFSRYQELIHYNQILAGFLLNNMGFEKVYENNFVIILKKPRELGGRCLPDEGIKIQ